jgi:heme-degrading monooxygenase HmoA
MYLSLCITKYKGFKLPFGILSMAILQVYFWFKKDLKFYKLMGSGQNGTFDIYPDFTTWCILTVWQTEQQALDFEDHSFVNSYTKTLGFENCWYLGQSIASHGKWDGVNPFETDTNPINIENRTISVLTRASIRLSKLYAFWSNVPKVGKVVFNQPGFIKSIGIGEVPFLKQSTFSIWENEEAIKKFAYRDKPHAEIVKKTKSQNWYSEDLFARFVTVKTRGKLRGEIL